MEPNLILEPGVEVTLADGNVYTFPPLACASLQMLTPKIEAIKGMTNEEALKTIVTVALHSLSLNYPTVSRKDLMGVPREDEEGRVVWEPKPLVNFTNMHTVMQAAMDVSGVKRAEQQAGKAPAGP